MLKLVATISTTILACALLVFFLPESVKKMVQRSRSGFLIKMGACEEEKRRAGMSWVKGADVAGGEYSEWSMTDDGCGTGPCHWNGAIIVNTTTCGISATFNRTYIGSTYSIQFNDFQAIQFPASTLEAINWVEGDTISGFTATMKGASASVDKLIGWYDSSGAVISYTKTISEPWFWTPGHFTPLRQQQQQLRSRVLAQRPEHAATVLSPKTLQCGTDYQRLRNSTREGPYLVMRSGSYGRGREWSGELHFNDTSCTVTGVAGDISFAPFKPLDLPSATLSAVGLTWMKAGTFSGFQADVQKGKVGGKMSGWYDPSSDTYLMFLSYDDGPKEIIHWVYAN